MNAHAAIPIKNLPSSPSLLDRARAQARRNNTCVGWATPYGAQVAFPGDSTTGRIWPQESLVDAQEAAELGGWRFELLGMEDAQ